MSAQFSDDDVGKRVVNKNGDEVGMVSAVEHGTAYVEPNPGITGTIKAKLGWHDRDEDAYPLQEAAVERVTDDEIRLTGDLEDSRETGTGGMGAGITDTDTTTGDTSVGEDAGTRDEGATTDDDNRMRDDDTRMRDDDDLMDDDDDVASSRR